MVVAMPIDRPYRACSLHPGSPVRRYRLNGPSGPRVYPQCVPTSGATPHLLAWTDERDIATTTNLSSLSAAERNVLDDAADGLTAKETALRHSKSIETVKSQRRAILLKLGARNMAHAVKLTRSAV